MPLPPSSAFVSICRTPPPLPADVICEQPRTRLLSSLPYPTLLEIKKPLLARGPLTSKIAGSSQNVLVIAFVFVCCVSNGLVPHQWSNAQKITYLNVCSLRVFAKCLCLCHCLCLYICLFLCHWSCVLITLIKYLMRSHSKAVLGQTKITTKFYSGRSPLPDRQSSLSPRSHVIGGTLDRDSYKNGGVWLMSVHNVGHSLVSWN